MSLLEKKQVQSVCLELLVGEQQMLYILLGANGTVNRLGRGTIDNDEHTMFYGNTADRLFESFMLDVDDQLFGFAGSYVDSEYDGEKCKLTMLFQDELEDWTGFEFIYGSESQGPPTEICDLVVSMIDLTDPWYDRQIRESQDSVS